MYLLRTADSRTRACASSAEQAVEQFQLLSREGLSPTVTDLAGRSLSVSDLKGLSGTGARDRVDEPVDRPD